MLQAPPSGAPHEDPELAPKLIRFFLEKTHHNLVKTLTNEF